ncbi:MAG: IclR family transcriptional regulator [Pseudophaeobacter sp.]|uniref:IclR family transcriptional regulator n=1 Tax=Pseudophaeobacter sp. TaxID=1971739 RepID=UPI00326453F4
MKSLETALNVLKVFIEADNDLSVNEVVELVDLKKSHVSKILSTLRNAGMVEQNPATRRYSVGVEAFELGTRYIVRSQQARDALPLMRQLANANGHSATLSVLRSTHVLHIMAVEGPHYIDGRWRVGSRLPIHGTSAGKVLLAWLPEAQRQELLDTLDLRPLTEKTITRRDRLEAVLADIRKSGCSVTRGESAPGLAALAVPVFDAKNEVPLALGVVLPETLFETEDLDQLREQLFEASRTLSLKLGAQDFPFGAGGAPSK